VVEFFGLWKGSTFLFDIETLENKRKNEKKKKRPTWESNPRQPKIGFFAHIARTQKLLNQMRFPLLGIPLPSLGAYTVDRKWQKCLEIF